MIRPRGSCDRVPKYSVMDDPAANDELLRFSPIPSCMFSTNAQLNVQEVDWETRENVDPGLGWRRKTRTLSFFATKGFVLSAVCANW